MHARGGREGAQSEDQEVAFGMTGEAGTGRARIGDGMASYCVQGSMDMCCRVTTTQPVIWRASERVVYSAERMHGLELCAAAAGHRPPACTLRYWGHCTFGGQTRTFLITHLAAERFSQRRSP